MRTGATEMLSDFISRRGRPFGAKLFVKENGRHGFEFAQRTGGARKKTTRKKSTTRKKTTRKKTPSRKKSATGKKTAARKKVTRKKSAAKLRKPKSS